jgi:hypothetical protein
MDLLVALSALDLLRRDPTSMNLIPWLQSNAFFLAMSFVFASPGNVEGFLARERIEGFFALDTVEPNFTLNSKPIYWMQ